MRLFVTLLCCLVPVVTEAAVITQPIVYHVDGLECTGVLVYDDSSTATRPGIVMVPNWKGVTEAAVTKAAMLAGTDRVVFVADMYGTTVRPTNASEAGAAATAVRQDRAAMQARGLAAIAELRTSNAPVDPSRIAAIGFCFGGGTVLELARIGAPVDAVVSFHGDLVSPTVAAADVAMPRILVCHGAIDPLVPMSDVSAFVTEMEAAGADYEFLMFSGAVHSFTDPHAAMPGTAAYQPEAARRSFAAMNTLFSHIW